MEKDGWGRIRPIMMDKITQLLVPDFTVRKIIEGYNSMAVPVAKYFYANIIVGEGKLSTLRAQARQFDMDTRKVLNEAKLRYRTANAERLYLSTAKGGMGMLSREDVLIEGMVYTWCYVRCRPELGWSRTLFDKMSASTKRSNDSDCRTMLKEHGLDVMIKTPTGRGEAGVLIGATNEPTLYLDATKAARSIMKLLRSLLSDRRLREWKSNLKAGCVPNTFGLLRGDCPKSIVEMS